MAVPTKAPGGCFSSLGRVEMGIRADPGRGNHAGAGSPMEAGTVMEAGAIRRTVARQLPSAREPAAGPGEHHWRPSDSDYYSSDLPPGGGKGRRRRRVVARRSLNYLPNASSRGVSGRAAGRGPPPAGAVAFLCNRGDRLPPWRSSGAIRGGRWDPDRGEASLSSRGA
jgi:hypothetical protein